MKVLQVIPDFGTGGAEKVVLNYMQGFQHSERIDMVTLVLSSDKNRLYERSIKEAGLNFVYLNQDISNNSIGARLKQIIQIRTFIKKYKPDIIHIHLSILWMICLAMAFYPRKKAFHTLHSDPRKTSYGKNRLIDTACYSLFRVTPICLNYEMKSYADEIFHRNDTLVLTNGIDIPLYRTNKRDSVRRELGVYDEFVVGHVGRFVDVKNHEKIVSVFSKIKQIEPTSKLVLVGDGELMEHIKLLCKERGISDSVLFLGTRSDVPNIMQAFDSFIFPSKYEGLGIVLVEAQAAGLHCVVSEEIPVEAIVTNKVDRLSLQENDAVWAKKILETNMDLSDEDRLNQYDIRSVLTQLEQYYYGE